MQCLVCSQEAKYKCGKCSVVYCGEECQKKDWNNQHNIVCKLLQLLDSKDQLLMVGDIVGQKIGTLEYKISIYFFRNRIALPDLVDHMVNMVYNNIVDHLVDRYKKEAIKIVTSSGTFLSDSHREHNALKERDLLGLFIVYWNINSNVSGRIQKDYIRTEEERTMLERENSPLGIDVFIRSDYYNRMLKEIREYDKIIDLNYSSISAEVIEGDVNNISYKLPIEIGNLIYLTELDLVGNQIKSTFGLNKLFKLRRLNL